MKMFRQGDVLLRQTTAPSHSVLQEVPIDPRGLVLAEGESSGHYHAVTGRGAKLCQFKESSRARRFLIVGDDGAEVSVVGGGSGGVPRHLPISLPGGTYEVLTQMAWTVERGAARVED